MRMMLLGVAILGRTKTQRVYSVASRRDSVYRRFSALVNCLKYSASKRLHTFEEIRSPLYVSQCRLYVGITLQAKRHYTLPPRFEMNSLDE